MHRRRLLSLAGPVYLELLAGVVAGVIDIAWVARLGAGAVAAVAVATNVENALMGVILVVELGATVLIARRRGAGDDAGVRTAIRATWLLFALVTPVVAVGGWLARDHIGAVFAAPGEAREMTVAFLAVGLPGIAVYFAQLTVNGIFKGLGDTRTPMRLAVLGNAVLLVLDPLLIYGLAGFPRLGVAGAAVATVTGRLIALAAGLLLLRARTRASAPLGEVWADARRIAATGVSMAAEFATRMVGALVMVAAVARFGPVAVAAYGIGTKAMYTATMGFYAIRQAATIHTSHTRGAGGGTDAIARETLLIGLGAGTVAAVAAFVAGPWAMRVFTDDAQVVAAGVSYLRWMAPYLLVLACLIASTGVRLGEGAGGRLFAVTLTGTLLQVPLAFGLSVPLGLPGVWLAPTLSVTIQFVLLRGGRPARGTTGRPRSITPWRERARGRTRRTRTDRPTTSPRT
ncbi:MATE family efflux transporter [Phytomonospora endophytica]|uniref:Probable multidrug resistance protein NorM n=1 Tax=Phytomonospora endophytica TaxID=714109 RepID=A0A841FQF6_9ACTN|nr:MATE family efflux transporter [Phytomonospora endophytica]MBB6034190.1 putative MATE family efflux protein [Phytomonospora endophytica]GIG66582.1 MATE efflux family protein [Phytomonospora endophytica]